MKKIIKYLVTVTLMIIGIIVALFSLLVLLALIAPKDQSNGSGSGSIQLEYNGNDEMPDFERIEPVYADTMEEALIINTDHYFKRYPYMASVNDVIKVFENDKYAAMFYHAVKDSKTEGTVASKFKVKIINGKKQYALVLVEVEEASSGQKRYNPLKTVREAAVFFDFFNQFRIVDGSRFIYGSLGTDKVKTMKIEGQSPTEVIEYTLLGNKEYFWYYEDLKSDKPSSELDIEMEDE